jgi:protein MAK11
MLKHIELGTLAMHTSTVSCVDFYQNANMLSGAEDGSICIWDAQSWDSLKVMRGHK